MELLHLLVVTLIVPVVFSSPENAAIIGNAGFSRELYAAVSGGSQNLVCSPLSAQMTLGLIRLGARGNTEAQISRALHLDNLNNDVANAAMRDLGLKITEADARNGTVIRLANRLYAASTLRMLPGFQSDAENYFGAKSDQLDFTDPAAAASTINSWVETFTQGKIRDLISDSSLSADTQLVLVNALYFRSPWKSGFDPAKTRNATFYVSPEKHVLIPFMFHEESEYRVGYFRDIKASLIELPYQGDKLSLVIVKPNVVTGLPALEQTMQQQDLGALLNQTSERSMEVALPRFTIEARLDLKDPLKMMGITDMFTSNADLSGLSSNQTLAVSEVIQKTFIEVSEQGTTAASATYAGIQPVSLPARFDANIPFLFFVVHRSPEPVVLFSGRFVAPPA